MWAEEFHVLLIHPEEPLDPNRHLCRCSWGCIPPAPCPAAAADAVGAASMLRDLYCSYRWPGGCERPTRACSGGPALWARTTRALSS